MKYALLFFIIPLFIIPLHAVLEQVHVVVLPNKEGELKRIFMFGDNHACGPAETAQFRCLEKLLDERSERGEKPLHMLLEKPLLFSVPPDPSILHQLTQLVDEKVKVEDIEVREVLSAARYILYSPKPEFLVNKFEDSFGNHFNLCDLTLNDIFDSFDRHKKRVQDKLKELQISQEVSDCHVDDADDFFDCSKNMFASCDTKIKIVDWAKIISEQEREDFILWMSQAFSPLLDLNAVCRVSEIVNGRGEIAIFTGSHHTNDIGDMLRQLGAYQLLNRPERASELLDDMPALNEGQLDVFDLPLPTWLLCRNRLRQACVIL